MNDIAQARAAAGIEVAPLVWIGDHEYQRARVDGLVGYDVYMVPSGAWIAEAMDLVGGRLIGRHPSAEAAKDASQAHRTGHILAALQVRP